MAEVDVVAPDGTRGTVPESELEGALADGFRLDAPEGPGSAPTAAPEREIDVRAPDGTVGTIPESELDAALEDGFEDLRDAKYRTTGQQVATGAEGFARGLTMGASDAVQTGGAGLGTGIGNFLADQFVGETPMAAEPGLDAPVVERPLYDTEAADAAYADIQGRKQANAALAAGTEFAGAVAPMLMSGGVGSAAAAARMTPAGQLAALSTKMGTLLTKRLGSSAAGRIGALAATGAAEAAVDNVTRSVMDSLAKGDVEISAERMMDGAWEATKAAALGGATAGTLGGLVEGVGAAARGVGKVLASLPKVKDFANGRAFKAALGRSNIALVRQADRYGGAEAIGDTLNRFDVTRGAAGVETIAERTGQLRQEIGQKIGAMVEEVGGDTATRSDLAQRIYSEVIDPLAKDAAKRPVARQLEGRVKDIIDDLTAPGEDVIGLKGLDDLRKSMGEMAAWAKRNPSESDEAYMDVYRLVSNYWSDAAEKAAAKSGNTEFADALRKLKKDYSHIAFANDAATDAVRSKLSNRFASPSDYGVGAATALASGSTTLGALAQGVAGAAVNKTVREHSNSLVANTLYNLANSGVARQRTLLSSVDNAMRSLVMPAAATAAPMAGRAASVLAPAMNIPLMVQQAQDLQDPNSEASNQLDAMTLQLSAESPDFAQAIRNKVMQRSALITQKVGPQIDPTDPLKSRPMPMDRVTRAKTDRFLGAMANPGAALDRLASGTGTAEDLFVVRELTPRVHKEFVDQVMNQVMGKGVRAKPAQLAKLHLALGVPVIREQTPQYVKFFQSFATKAPEPAPVEQKAQQEHWNPNEFKVDNGAMARADSITTRGAGD